MNHEEEAKFIEELREKSRQRPVKYFPSVEESISYPTNPFTDQYTTNLIANAIDLSVIRGKEVSLEGNIIDGIYTVSNPVVGEKDMVLTERQLSPTKENPHNPYQATIFEFHTHPKNLTPSEYDLHGYLLATGSIQQAIWHKKSKINPLFIIGRSTDGKREMLCYQFLKEKLPTPNNIGEQDDFIQEYYKKLKPILNPAQHISNKLAEKESLDYFINVMNSCEGIKAFGKTI